MASNKENTSKSKYRIKLLAEKNVVLVEADNYETEIFTPKIVDGRITFLNIIPNRRCCKTFTSSNKNSMENISKATTNKNQTIREQNQEKLCRYSQEQDVVLMTKPLANSTPANIKQRISYDQLYNNHLFGLNSQSFSNNSILPTPEHVRRAVTVKPQMFENSMLNLPNDIKVAPVYSSPNEGTHKRIRRLVGPSHTSNCLNQLPANNSSRLNGSYSFMTSPIIKRNSSKGESTVNIYSITGSLKVLTPVRTYTRKSKQPVMLQRPVKVASVKKFSKPYRITPTYLVNPTKGPNVTKCIEIKKRKLLIDPKLCISPKTFKRQQEETFDNCQFLAKPLALPKSRQHRNTFAMSAFDLLTNSNRIHCMCSKLNVQFRKGCINKASSTYIKYKILSRIPPLQQDKQVLEISCTSIRAD